jgi:predicted PurR-regulated permease PerM
MTNQAIIECIRLCEPLKIAFFAGGVINFAASAIVGFLARRGSTGAAKKSNVLLLVTYLLIAMGFVLISISLFLVPYIVAFIVTGSFTVTNFTCNACGGSIAGK